MVNTGLGQITKNLCNLVSKGTNKNHRWDLGDKLNSLDGWFQWDWRFPQIIKNIRMEMLPEGY